MLVRGQACPRPKGRAQVLQVFGATLLMPTPFDTNGQIQRRNTYGEGRVFRDQPRPHLKVQVPMLPNSFCTSESPHCLTQDDRIRHGNTQGMGEF